MESSISTFTRYRYPLSTIIEEQQTHSENNFSVVRRNSDVLTVVQTKALSESANALNAEAAKQPGMPLHTPDGAGAILIFHTQSGSFVLGGLRHNPGLVNARTEDGTAFPKQVSATVGGYMASPERPLRESVMIAIKNKLFLNAEGGEKVMSSNDRNVLEDLCYTIDSVDGWEDKVCVHTDKWDSADGTDGTMCYLTGIKHIACSDDDLGRIETALRAVMTQQKESGAAQKTISDFEFVALDPIIENSRASYLDDEITKASNAYKKFKDKVAVTFNDLCVATLDENHAFQCGQVAHLLLRQHDAIDPEGRMNFQLPVSLNASLSTSLPSSSSAPLTLRSENQGVETGKRHPALIKFRDAKSTILRDIHLDSSFRDNQKTVDAFIATCETLMQAAPMFAKTIKWEGELLLANICANFFSRTNGRRGERLKLPDTHKLK